ncbi:MAG: hypothetical protein E7576_02530 [Ruminococcaceae bacterium]|nr:hypothetical protein [Oscillospiraceae bacterium]
MKKRTAAQKAATEAKKNKDDYNRWRSRQTSFRLSEEEFAQLSMYVKLSGKSKQEYITDRVLNRDVVVQGNTRVFKALRDTLAEVLAELRRIEAGGEVSPELNGTIRMIAGIMDGLRGEDDKG